MKKEIWKKTKISNVLVSNHGNIKNENGVLLPVSKGKNGYLTKTFRIEKCVYKNMYIHRLVAQTFIKNKECKKQVNHKNGIKTDNRIQNLEWVTNQENSIHAWKNGLKTVSENRAKGVKINTCKLTEKEVKKIKDFHKNKEYNMSQLGKMFNVSKTAIRYIVINRNWSWLN